MYYITISNGLLQGDHQKKMGNSVWQFMWCIDKITMIDSKGEGRVLGGKPIKLSDIGGASERTISRNLNKLEKLGYLKLIHAPYGIVIRVMKAKKIFQKRPANNGVPLPERVDISGVPLTKNGVPNKIIQLDKTIYPNKSSGTKTMKKNTFGKYNENNSSDSFEESIDLETGEKEVVGKKTNVSKVYKELIEWSEKRRGFKFMNYPKQFKWFSIARKADIPPNKLMERWKEFEDDKFWKEKGFDWAEVINNFSKRQ